MTEPALPQPDSARPGVHILASPHTPTAIGGYTALSAYALANSLLWNSVHPLLLPIIVLGLAGEELKNSVLGGITFVGLIVAMVAQPLWGALSDNARTRWGRRRPFIVAGALGTALLLAALGQAGTLGALFALYVALQLVFNSSLAAYQGLIPDLVPPHRRGVASGAKNFAEVLGLIIAALAISSLVTETSLLPGFVAIIAVFALGTAITCLAIREPAAAGAPPAPAVESLRGAFRVSPRRHADFFWMLAGRLLFVVAMTSIQAFSLFYIRDVLRPADALSLWRDLTASIGLAILLVTYPAGLLADRIGRRPVILAAGACAGAGALLMMGATESTGVLVFGTLVGLGIGLFLSANWALATDLIPPGEGARFMGLTNLATAGGAALARLNGPVIDLLNDLTPLLGYRALLLGVGVSFLVGALLVLKVHEPRRLEPIPSPPGRERG